MALWLLGMCFALAWADWPSWAQELDDYYWAEVRDHVLASHYGEYIVLANRTILKFAPEYKWHELYEEYDKPDTQVLLRVVGREYEQPEILTNL